MVRVKGCSFKLGRPTTLTATSQSTSFGQRAEGSPSLSHSTVSFRAAVPVGYETVCLATFRTPDETQPCRGYSYHRITDEKAEHPRGWEIVCHSW